MQFTRIACAGPGLLPGSSVKAYKRQKKVAIRKDGYFCKDDYLMVMGSEGAMAKMTRTVSSEMSFSPPSTTPEVMCFLAV